MVLNLKFSLLVLRIPLDKNQYWSNLRFLRHPFFVFLFVQLMCIAPVCIDLKLFALFFPKGIFHISQTLTFPWFWISRKFGVDMSFVSTGGQYSCLQNQTNTNAFSLLVLKLLSRLQKQSLWSNYTSLILNLLCQFKKKV